MPIWAVFLGVFDTRLVTNHQVRVRLGLHRAENQLTFCDGGQLMDDTARQAFFTQPTQTHHRRYEALRAVFVDGRSQKDVAAEFGFTYGSMRQLVFNFRQSCSAEDETSESPFFETSILGVACPVTTRTRKILIRR